MNNKKEKNDQDLFVIESDDLCSIVTDLLLLYSDGLLSEASEKFVKNHLEKCQSCQQVYALIQKNIPEPETNEKIAEDAFRKINRKFRWQKTFLFLLVLCCLILTGTGLWFIWRNCEIPASEISISLLYQNDHSVELSFSHAGSLHLSHPENRGDGLWQLYAYQFPLEVKKKEAVSEKVTFQQPADEILLDDEIIFQNGIVITPRCRQLYPFANGYAGATVQMSLAYPDFYGYTFHIEADTDNPESCIWTFVNDTPQASLKDLKAEIIENYRKNVFVALALTPNLEAVCLQENEGDPMLIASRSDLEKLLESNRISSEIASLSDLQKILSVILGPAG